MRFLSNATNFLWFKLLLLALVVWLIVLKDKYARAAVQSLAAFLLANGITDLFKNYLPMNRPFVDLSPGQMFLRIGDWPTSGEHVSFGTASAHSANMAAVAFVFVYHLGWMGSPWVPIAIGVGLSRIYNGVHYPYQVLLGWCCGLFAAAVVTKSWERIVRRRQSVEPPEEAPEAI